LANPSELQFSSFGDRGPLGFGLVQRDRSLENYEDLNARFDRRPSVWIEAVGDWGAGRVELVEIPSNREANDNIVVFWRPEAPIPMGGPWTLAYRMRWTDRPTFGDGLAEVRATRSGMADDGERRQFIIDFDLGPLHDVQGITLDVSSSAGTITDQQLMPVPERALMRVGFVLAPEDQGLIELRAQLRSGDQRLSETWLYRWTPS
jgi:glucans biosynthesis protein